jgi:hypothetical protein
VEQGSKIGVQRRRRCPGMVGDVQQVPRRRPDTGWWVVMS